MILRVERQAFDAILLDVDNGPEGLARKENDWLYARPGLEAAHAALRPAGVLGVWSSGPHPVFVQRLRRAGFTVDEVRAPAHDSRKGRRHTIWLAGRGRCVLTRRIQVGALASGDDRAPDETSAPHRPPF